VSVIPNVHDPRSAVRGSPTAAVPVILGTVYAVTFGVAAAFFATVA
jgi:hypothetical protein